MTQAGEGADRSGKASFLEELTPEPGSESGRCAAHRTRSWPGEVSVPPRPVLAAVLQLLILYPFFP